MCGGGGGGARVSQELIQLRIEWEVDWMSGFRRDKKKKTYSYHYYPPAGEMEAGKGRA